MDRRSRRAIESEGIYSEGEMERYWEGWAVQNTLGGRVHQIDIFQSRHGNLKTGRVFPFLKKKKPETVH